MVKLTAKYLFRKISKKNQLQPRKNNETDIDYLNRLTHLQLQSQFIDKIASSIPECQSVSVIYLQNNLLQSIHNLENFKNLTHLYLQHNYISKIENFDKLKSLRKLYLGYNEISVVEGLETLDKLTELHLESQRLSHGETLYFDPNTLSKLGKSLKVLNVSNNNITSMRCLASLLSLSKLIIEDNQIKDVDDVMETLYCLPSLETLNSEGNPVAADRKFLDAAIIASASLKVLNGKTIEPKTRIFIQNLSYNKECQRKLSEFSTRAVNSDGFSDTQEENAFSLRELACKSSSRLGSKLFPFLKFSQNYNPRTIKMHQKASALGSSPVVNSLKVSSLSGSASYYL